jgi:hypothetical protein
VLIGLQPSATAIIDRTSDISDLASELVDDADDGDEAC